MPQKFVWDNSCYKRSADLKNLIKAGSHLLLLLIGGIWHNWSQWLKVFSCMVSFWDQRRSIPIVAKWNCPNTLCCMVVLHLVCKLLNFSAIQELGLCRPCWNEGGLILLIEKGIILKVPMLLNHKRRKEEEWERKGNKGGICQPNTSEGLFCPWLRSHRTKSCWRAGPVPTCSLLCPSCPRTLHKVCSHKYWLIKAQEYEVADNVKF